MQDAAVHRLSLFKALADGGGEASGQDGEALLGPFGGGAACVDVALRNGLEQAEPMDCSVLQCLSIESDFSYLKEYTPDYVQRLIDNYAAKVFTDDASDADEPLRWNIVFLRGARRIQAFVKEHSAIHGRVNALRLGELEIFGAPFEIMSAIYRDARDGARAPIPLVASLCNGSFGYAPDNTQLVLLKDDEQNFAGRVVPMILGLPPYSNIHNELLALFRQADAALFG